MGRRTLTKEHKQIKKREWNRKFISDPEKLAKKRERDRVQKRERSRQARIVGRNPLGLLANAATQVQMLTEINIQDKEELLRSSTRFAPEPMDAGIGGIQDNWNENEGSMQLMMILI